MNRAREAGILRPNPLYSTPSVGGGEGERVKDRAAENCRVLESFTEKKGKAKTVQAIILNEYHVLDSNNAACATPTNNFTDAQSRSSFDLPPAGTRQTWSTEA